MARTPDRAGHAAAHHHGLGHLRCQCRTANSKDAMQKKVDAGRYASAGEHRPVDHKHAVADDFASGLDSLKFVQMVVVSQHCSVRMPLMMSRPMPCCVSHMSSPVPTSALCLPLVNAGAGVKPARPSSGTTRPDSSANGLSFVLGPSTCSTRTIGTPRAAQPAINAFWANR